MWFDCWSCSQLSRWHVFDRPAGKPHITAMRKITQLVLKQQFTNKRFYFSGKDTCGKWKQQMLILSTGVHQVNHSLIGPIPLFLLTVDASWSVTFFFFDVSIDGRLPSALTAAQLVASSLRCSRLQTSFPSDWKATLVLWQESVCIEQFFEMVHRLIVAQQESHKRTI